MSDTHIHACENYLTQRTGCYTWRAVRYNAAAIAMKAMGLTDDSLVVDVGSGWTELDFCLRTEHTWRGRYHPVDGMLDGVNLNQWTPPRQADFFVALEVLEHLDDPARLILAMQRYARCGVVVSVPNPRTTDVLGMDDTHVSVVGPKLLRGCGFTVEERAFYGGHADSLFAVWRRA